MIPQQRYQMSIGDHGWPRAEQRTEQAEVFCKEGTRSEKPRRLFFPINQGHGLKNVIDNKLLSFREQHQPGGVQGKILIVALLARGTMESRGGHHSSSFRGSWTNQSKPAIMSSRTPARSVALHLRLAKSKIVV